jgi:transposase
MEMRVLSDHRQDLVAERTRIRNRLRWHLLELCNDLEPTLRRRRAGQTHAACPRRPAPAQAAGRCPRACRAHQISQLRGLGRQIDALQSELLELVTAHRPQLLEQTGCGALTAAILIGRTAGAQRFATDASFTRQTGTAPIPASSGLATATASIAATTASSTTPCTSSPPPARATTRHQCLPRPQTSRRQDPQRRHPLPQTPPRQTLQPSPLTPTNNTANTEHHLT